MKLNFSKPFIVDYARKRASDFKHLPVVALSILSKSTNFLLIYLISINMSSRFIGYFKDEKDMIERQKEFYHTI